MVLQSFMKNKFIFPLFVFLFSCNTKTNIVLDEVVDQVTLDEVIKAPTEYLYGINLDSFSYITQKIKWGQSFSDILSRNGVSNKDIFDETFPQDKQIGGSHYKSFFIQPWTFIRKNGLNPFQANVIKYVCRYLNKNGVEDLEKIKHYCDLEIEHLKEKKKK